MAGAFSKRPPPSRKRGDSTAMNDLSDEIRRRVDAARKLDSQQREEKERQAQEQTNLEQQRKARARDLNGEIERRMEEAAGASDGAMQYVSAMAGIGAIAHFLEWQAPAPERVLEVTVNYHVGTIRWNWGQGRARQGGQEEDVLTFDMTRLSALILALTDQAVWSQGNLPRVP
jgi:Flp pilus assembly protein TadB